MASIIIRDALLTDVETCQAIEKDAAKRFLSSDITEIKAVADDDLLPPEILINSIQNEVCFIAEIDQKPVGFIALTSYTNSWYIEEISVVEHAQSQGVGNGLLSYIKMLAEIKRIASINLITFRDVEWNQPYYTKKGYVSMAEERLSEQFLALWQQDNQHFAPKLRVCMQLKIDVNKF
ncbi:MAG: GNAT family N-acetyltransferase [Alphaproteobacteria bacterium]|nr:GNAT family N-acetyltransferase [Alphaproteobacteria bacterium]